MNHFDQVAATWDENPVRLAMSRTFAEVIKDKVALSGDTRMLGFGCGTGNLSLCLADSVGKITAIDTSPEMLSVLKTKSDQLNADIRTIAIDITSELFDDSFDLICSSMALHHIEDTADLFARFSHLLNCGGQLVLFDLFIEDGSFHPDRPVPHSGFDPDELAELLKARGFVDCWSQHVHEISKEQADGSIRQYPVFMLTAVKAS